jgi:hypothetical protein
MILAFLSGMNIRRRVLTNLLITAAAAGVSYGIGTLANALWVNRTVKSRAVHIAAAGGADLAARALQGRPRNGAAAACIPFPGSPPLPTPHAPTTETARIEAAKTRRPAISPTLPTSHDHAGFYLVDFLYRRFEIRPLSRTATFLPDLPHAGPETPSESTCSSA